MVQRIPAAHLPYATRKLQAHPQVNRNHTSYPHMRDIKVMLREAFVQPFGRALQWKGWRLMLKNILTACKEQTSANEQRLHSASIVKQDKSAKAQKVASRSVLNHHLLRLAHFGHSQSEWVPRAPILHLAPDEQICGCNMSCGTVTPSDSWAAILLAALSKLQKGANVIVVPGDCTCRIWPQVAHRYMATAFNGKAPDSTQSCALFQAAGSTSGLFSLLRSSRACQKPTSESRPQLRAVTVRQPEGLISS